MEPEVFKISKFFEKATPNIFKFKGGSVLFTFLLPWF